MSEKGELKRKRNKTRHEFLLTLFDSDDKEVYVDKVRGRTYAVKEMNGFVLVRQFNSNIKNWEVAIYTKESFSRRLF